VPDPAAFRAPEAPPSSVGRYPLACPLGAVLALAMGTLSFIVTEADTALALGSGDVPVLATPRLLAWIEASTVVAAREHLDDGQTTVGTHVELRHRRPTAVGRTVRVEVSSVQRSGTRLMFEASVYERYSDGPDRSPIATAHVTRAVVDRAAFVAALDQD
jgi:fluoroacetyl-CoA thioesterase